MSDLKEQIDRSRLPRHIAIIMDGNGRWAMQQGRNRIFGHEHGVESVRQSSEACAEMGIECLTLYAFSTENWRRPQDEVNALMNLLVKTISGEMETLQKNNISLHAIGDIEKMPADCQEELRQAIRDTSGNTGLKLILALSYSGRWDILEAIRKMVRTCSAEQILEELDEDYFKQFLTTAPFPDPELMIRTSGEHRLSNFLLWELAYAEMYFSPKLWPEFRKEDLWEALLDYQNRERRFGMTSQQITTK